MGLCLRIAWLVMLFAVVPRAQALDVYFAGFAWLGDDASLDSNYPYSRALNARSGSAIAPFDAALFAKLRAAKFDGFTLKFDELGSLGADSPSSLALAFVLDRETAFVEPLAAGQHVVVEVSGQALFFDFRESAVVASFPVVDQFIGFKPAGAAPVDIAAIVRDRYFDESSESNVFNDFVQKLGTLKFNPNVARRIQVTDVKYDAALRPLLPDHFARDDRAFRNSLAQEFSKHLSSAQNIPVLPYTVGSAIGNRMAGRFSDGRVFDLRIPEPDYVIALDLQNLRKIEYASTPAGKSWVYGAYLHVRASEPLSNTVFFDATIKNGATKVVAASQTVTDDWPPYQEALMKLMERFSDALSNPTAAWAKEHTGDAAAVKQMNSLQKVLQSCR